MTEHADPSQWNRIPVDPGRTAPEREPVPGIISVSQRLMLFANEWMCPGCQAVIEQEGSTYRMLHGDGCSVIAEITEIQQGAK